MVDFTRYQPPGVYVEGTSESVVTASGAPATTVSVVGESRGYQVHTQSVSLVATPTALLKKGVLPDSDSSPDLKVTKADGTVLAETTDYTLVRGATSADSTTITRVAGSTATTVGEVVVVVYSYADSTYYAPKSFQDFASIEATYGQSMVSVLPTNPDATQVSSPLSLGARIAFENGATSIICVAVEPVDAGNTLRARFAQAYAKLANDFATTLLVPILASTDGDSAAYTSGFQGFVSDAKVHCESQSDDGFGRIAVVGADSVFDETATTFEEIASGTKSKRVILAYPYRMNFYNNSLGQSTEVGGAYLAAAFAGRLAAAPINRGLTQQQVFGFSGIPADLRQEMNRSFKDSLSASGVAVAEPSRNGTTVVRHGISTDTTDLTTSEISLTRTYDVLYQMVLEGLQSVDLVGDPIDDDMTIRIKGILTGILETAKGDLVIRDWLSLQVRQQSLPSGDPTAIECIFSYQPFLPLNFIVVGFSMDLTTGEITATDTTLAA